jgi:hypothetical protein
MQRTQRTLNTAGVLVHSVCVFVCVCLCVQNGGLQRVNIQYQGSEVSYHVEHPVVLKHNMFLFYFILRRLITLISDNVNVIYTA